MNRLDQIEALTDRVDGPLPSAGDIYLLELNATERNLIADALKVLYGAESIDAAITSGDRRDG